MKKVIFSLLIIITISFSLQACSKISSYKKITPEEAKEMMDDGGVIILDVREQYEYDSGHIEDAVLLPLGMIDSQAEVVLPDKNAIILVYCRTGNRSATASKKLISMGYINVYDFGGITDWPYPTL